MYSGNVEAGGTGWISGVQLRLQILAQESSEVRAIHAVYPISAKPPGVYKAIVTGSPLNKTLVVRAAPAILT